MPNITPDKQTGIGKWSKSELVEYLRRGEKPDGDFAGGLMAEVIDNGLSKLSEQDMQSLASYVMTLPPIINSVSKPKKQSGEYD